MYSNSCCSCSFEAEILKIGQSSHKMYRNNNEFSRVYDKFKCLYKNSLETYLMAFVYIYIYIYIYTLKISRKINPTLKKGFVVIFHYLL